MATFRGIACVACLVFSFGSAFAQEVSSSYAISKVEDSKPKKVEVVKTDEGIAVKTKNFSFKPYGFFRNDFYYDSRTNFETANGLFYIIPKDEDFNEEGQDMNGESSTNFLSIATRIGVRVTGPDFLKAKTLGVVEGDFAGCGSSPTSRGRSSTGFLCCRTDWLAKRRRRLADALSARTAQRFPSSSC